jgi:hypothetical protein
VFFVRHGHLTHGDESTEAKCGYLSLMQCFMWCIPPVVLRWPAKGKKQWVRYKG